MQNRVFKSISLDARASGADMDFVSHAHSDHIAAARSSRAIVCSNQTAELINVAYGISPNLVEAVPQNVRLLDSGHMLGSKQLLIDCGFDSNSVLYSGDFQMMESAAASRIQIRNADILIIDSTYPDPALNFDSKDVIEDMLLKWVSRALKEGIVLFKAYAMGKAQELIRILNRESIIPVVSRKISAINSVYVRNGIGLEYASYYDIDSDYESLVRGNFVGITDSQRFYDIAGVMEHAYKKRVYTAVATGFAKSFRFRSDAQFALSDHADFRQSCEYIDAVSPKKVYTYGQNRELFAANLSSHGYKAEPYQKKAIDAV
ncbi:hypothetical protein M1373_00710 [Candidatus Marsarchaeota archaeon]|nr:hypothetical protein [Candidatus Marsarchaeota archaeon]MCL5404396.1 hypothetical protein [Candidatus Marsarchaeota archaeon]